MRKKDEMCSIANYGNVNSMCEQINTGRIASDIAAETEGWQMLVKSIQNRTINNLKLMNKQCMYK